MKKQNSAPVGKMNPKVDWYFVKNKKWQEEIIHLRDIALGCGLNEELKWGCPCYTLNGNNIVLIHVFKDYCAYLFFKGVLLKDPKKILIQQTANVQVARQIRFTDVKEIVKLRTALKSYIKNAIEVEKKGVKAPLKKTKEFEMADEFKTKLKDPALKKAFYALTPGRQRGYLLYFSSAKQSATREARVKKAMSKILNGKGLDD
jgi:uncharacterized protein YdeI (YjbR/CyaY-like superfamily)